MRVNEFGRKARVMRLERDLSLKEMADAMLISSAHLSGLEYGDKKLNEAHIEMAASFFRAHGVTEAELDELRLAGARSFESVSLKSLDGDARAKVYAFARRLQDGDHPPSDEIENWIKRRQ